MWVKEKLEKKRTARRNERSSDVARSATAEHEAYEDRNTFFSSSQSTKNGVCV